MYIITVYSKNPFDRSIFSQIDPVNYHFDEERNTYTFFVSNHYTFFIVKISRLLHECDLDFLVMCDKPFLYIKYMGQYHNGKIIPSVHEDMQYFSNGNINKIKRRNFMVHNTSYINIWDPYMFSSFSFRERMWWD